MEMATFVSDRKLSKMLDLAQVFTGFGTKIPCDNDQFSIACRCAWSGVKLCRFRSHECGELPPPGFE